VSFVYREVARGLDPYGLLLRDGYWYVIGRDHAHDEVRTYRVDRIAGQVTQGRAGSFARPGDIDLRAVFPADPKLLGEPEVADQRAVVTVDAARAPLVVAEIGQEAVLDRYDDGSVSVVVPCVNRDAFRTWLLGLTTHAVVDAPAELREELVSWLREIAAGGPS
jgi:predicted DNA-binding transcriptional regulator YafY